MWCRYMGAFLREHGREVYPEIVATYSDTMNKVSRQDLRHGGAGSSSIHNLNPIEDSAFWPSLHGHD